MRKSTSIMLAVIVLLGCRCAAEKITVDPNTSRNGKAETIAESGSDSRLAMKVSYEATHQPLKIILKELSTLTGVELNAGFSSADWQVRDRKMNIFVKDLPLAALMNSIARVMKYRWTINDEKNPPTYRLVMDRKTIGKMEQEFSRKQDDLKQETIAGRHKLMDAMAKVAGMSDQEIEGLKDDNPYLYLIGKTGLAKLTTTIFNECPRIADTWVNMRRNLAPPASLLSPETKELFFQVMRANYPYRELDPNAVCPDGAEIGFDTHLMVMENLPRPFTNWERNQLYSYGGLGCYTDKGFFHLGSYVDPESTVAQQYAKTCIDIVDGHKSNEQVQAEISSATKDAYEKEAEENDRYLLIEPLVEHEPDTDLQKKVKVKLDNAALQRLDHPQRIAAIQKAMSEAGGFGIVSDSFARFLGSIDITSDEKEFQSILDNFAKGLGDNWEKHGTVIEMHNRDWFRKRAAQIPDGWIERWKASLKKTGQLSFDEYCKILMLTVQQLEENILADPVLKCCGQAPQNRNLVNYHTLVRLYLRLDANQRAMLFTPDGLPFGSLNPDQWQAANAMLYDPYCLKWDMDTLIKEAQDRLCMREKIIKFPDGNVVYQFTLSAEDPNITENVKYLVLLPKYDGPEKTEAAGGK